MNFTELRLVCRLVFAHAWQHPGRMLLTAFSTIAAACIVVWVVSGYDSLTGKFGNLAENYLGRYSLIVLATEKESEGGRGGDFMNRTSSKTLSNDLLDDLKKSEEVEALDLMYEARVRIRTANASEEELFPQGEFGNFGPEPAAAKSPGKNNENAKSTDTNKSNPQTADTNSN